jgi:hypothetical protein
MVPVEVMLPDTFREPETVVLPFTLAVPDTSSLKPASTNVPPVCITVFPVGNIYCTLLLLFTKLYVYKLLASL